MSVIKFSNVTKLYDGVHGIKDVSFEVNSGEILGFIGPNGTGKSTTIRTMLGLLKENNGQVDIFDLPFNEHREQILQNIGYVPSEISYYDDMNANDLLLFSQSFYGSDCSHERERLVKLFDLDMKKKIRDMSLGNRKKVAIIQALQHKPKLVVLDEPTSGLDPLMQQNVYDELLAVKLRGGTVFFSSHILSEVQRLCDRIAIIKAGQIVEMMDVESALESKYVHVKLELNDSLQNFAITNMENYKVEGQVISFIYKGNINLLVQEISKYNLHSLYLSEPDLETIFMHYYRE